MWKRLCKQTVHILYYSKKSIKHMFADLLAHLTFLYCTNTFLTSYNDTFKSNWAAQKPSKLDTFSSILPICINTHGQYIQSPMCPKCAYKISQIFSRVFEFALAEFYAPRIFPLLQYFKLHCLAVKRPTHIILMQRGIENTCIGYYKVQRQNLAKCEKVPYRKQNTI